MALFIIKDLQEADGYLNPPLFLPTGTLSSGVVALLLDTGTCPSPQANHPPPSIPTQSRRRETANPKLRF